MKVARQERTTSTTERHREPWQRLPPGSPSPGRVDRPKAQNACRSFPPRMVPGTTRRHANASATALQRPRSPKGVVLAPRSQTAAFEPPRRRARHRRTSPAAAVLPGLVTTFALPITLLSGTVPRSAAVRPGSRPSAVSVPRDDFGGPNTEAPPYPPAAGFRGSAPSSERLTGKPFRASRG